MHLPTIRYKAIVVNKSINVEITLSFLQVIEIDVHMKGYAHTYTKTAIRNIINSNNIEGLICLEKSFSIL